MARKRDETFLLYYYQDFFEYEEDNPTGLYCLSDTTVQIILSALRFSTWPTRWRVDRQDENRAIANEYWDTVKAWGDLAIREVLHDMSCDLEAGFTTLAGAITEASNKDAISELALAVGRLADAQCCDNLQIDVQAGFQGTITQGSGEVVPIYGSEPPGGLAPETFPEAYPTLEAYNADKCRMANNIVDGLIIALNNMAAFETLKASTLGVLIIVAVGSTIVFPPSLIPIAITVLVVLVVESYVMGEMSDAILANRDEWVCQLYEGENTESVMGWIADTLDIIISAMAVSGPIGFALKALGMLLMNANTINKLFTGSELAIGPDVDCSGCGEVEVCDTCIYRHLSTQNIAEWVVPSEDWWEVVASATGGYYTIQVRIYGPDSYRIMFRNMVGWTQYVGPNNFWIRDSAGAVVHSSNNFSAFALLTQTYCHEAGNWSQIEIISQTNFTVEAKTEYCD